MKLCYALEMYTDTRGVVRAIDACGLMRPWCTDVFSEVSCEVCCAALRLQLV